MIKVLLYWNNICVLHKKEQEYLEHITKCLEEQGILLQIRYFGLGYPTHMSEYLREEEAVLPDLIVSTDLEVFEDYRIFDRFQAELYPAADWIELKENTAVKSVYRSNKLLPFLIIPLVFFTNQPMGCEETGIGELIGHQPIAFGGINNSAVKTVVKAVWSRYGKEAALQMVTDGIITEMPVQAFQKVRTGECNVAIVPTLYALRADERNYFARCPKDGTVALPSYICARNSIPKEAAQAVIRELTAPDFCNFFVKSGDLICGVEGTAVHPWLETQEAVFLFPDKEWFMKVVPEEFYSFYCKAIPDAHCPV